MVGTVMVYEDPITKTKPEGRAIVILTVGEPSDGLILATVWFSEDQARGWTDTYQRWVSVQDMIDAGYQMGGGNA